MNLRTPKSNLLTLMERKTRFTLTASLQTKTAAETAQNIQERLADLPSEALKTITFDNGGEFAHFAEIEDVLDIEAYFCNPHSPWQHGGMENTNGIIRRDMPRKTDIKDDSDQDIDDITWNLNTTPRKSLGFRTPAEAFFHNLQNCT